MPTERPFKRDERALRIGGRGAVEYDGVPRERRERGERKSRDRRRVDDKDL